MRLVFVCASVSDLAYYYIVSSKAVLVYIAYYKVRFATFRYCPELYQRVNMMQNLLQMHKWNNVLQRDF